MGSKVSLESSGLFEGLTPAILGKIRTLASEERYASGVTIFSEGDLAHNIYILAEGEVELTCNLPGRTPLTMRIAHIVPGEVFGWSALALGEKLTADAQALAECIAYLLPGDRLLEVLNQDPVSGYRVMLRLSQIIAKRLRDTRHELRWIQSAI